MPDSKSTVKGPYFLFFRKHKVVSTKLLTVLQDEEITRIYLNAVSADTNKGSQLCSKWVSLAAMRDSGVEEGSGGWLNEIHQTVSINNRLIFVKWKVEAFTVLLWKLCTNFFFLKPLGFNTGCERRAEWASRRKKAYCDFFFFEGLWVVVFHFPGTVSASLKFPELRPILWSYFSTDAINKKRLIRNLL